MNPGDRPIALTDLETTGDIPAEHEILEIGLVLFDPKTHKVLDSLDLKVKPKHIETAIPAAIQANGYNDKDWMGAVNLEEAIKIYAEKTKGAIFCAYNATFDWGFIIDAFRVTGVKNEMDYHRLDVLTMAWDKGIKTHESWKLKSVCAWLGITPEPDPHTALKGALTAFEVFKKLNPLD